MNWWLVAVKKYGVMPGEPSGYRHLDIVNAQYLPMPRIGQDPAECFGSQFRHHVYQAIYTPSAAELAMIDESVFGLPTPELPEGPVLMASVYALDPAAYPPDVAATFNNREASSVIREQVHAVDVMRRKVA